MITKISKTFLIAIAILVYGCFNDAPAEDDGTIDTEKVVSVDNSTQSPEKEAVPIPFPIYTSFSQVAYLFEQQNDTTYVINFWATWCKPCVEELPYFEQLHAAYKDEKVKVILLSLDFAKQIEKKLVPFVRDNNLESEVIALLDADYNSWIDKVNPDWDGAIPVTYIYNNENKAFVSEQFERYEDLESIVKEVMN